MSRYRDDDDNRRDEDFETRRGQRRSYAEEQFNRAQRGENDREREPVNDSRQFDYGASDRDQAERDARRSNSMGTVVNSDPRDARPYRDYQSRDARDAQGRPADRDTNTRFDRQYRQSDYADYTGTSGAIGSSRPDDRDDYGRRSTSYTDERIYPGGASAQTSGQQQQQGRTTADTRDQQQQARQGASRSHVRCRDIMTRDVTVATRDMTLRHVAAMMRDEDTGVIPVVEPQTSNQAATSNQPTTEAIDDQTMTVTTQGSATNQGSAASQASDEGRRGERSYGKLVGLITDRDIVVRAIAEGKDATITRAEEVMTGDVHTAQPNDRVIDAIRKMGDKQVRRIPVCDRDGNLRGIISMADVALETEEDRELAHALEEISSGSSFWSKMFG